MSLERQVTPIMGIKCVQQFGRNTWRVYYFGNTGLNGRIKCMLNEFVVKVVVCLAMGHSIPSKVKILFTMGMTTC
jgi:hypothetical protein